MQGCLDAEQFEKCDSGKLSQIEVSRFREHLSSCLECRSAYQKWRAPKSGRADETTHSVRGATTNKSAPSEKFAQALPQIEGFRITGMLGQGGMGVVYRAVQTKLNRVVALKLLPMIVASPQAISRFRREAKAAARLHHTNIVPIYDFGESRDGYYYAMELIEGRPFNEFIQSCANQNLSTASPTQLAGVLRRNSFNVESLSVPTSSQSGVRSASGVYSSSSTGRGRAYFRQVARWMADAAAALHYAHGQGIIHRDIKPGNMILSDDGRIMITDFGLAKTEDDTSISVVGALIGAIRYLSPEQAMAGRLQLDHRTDIWSLGATFYELLTFRPAFPGTDEKQILSAIISKDPPPPSKLDSHVPAELEIICLKTLEKDPDHRYATAHALAEDLQRWLDDIPIHGKRAGLVRRSHKFVRRHNAITTAAVAALLIALMSWGFTAGRQGWQAKEFVSKGKLAEKDADWVLAAQNYREADRCRPNNANILFDLARALQEQYDRRAPEPGMAAEALQYCERALALDPNLTNIKNTYGVLLSMNGQVDDAIAVFKKDMKEGAAAAHIYNNVAAVRYLDKDDHKAREAFEKAIENPAIEQDGPDGTKVRKPYFHAYHELATLQLLQGDPLALATIERGIDHKPESDNHFGYHLVHARILLTLSAVRNDVQGSSAAEIADGNFEEDFPDPLIKRYLALGWLRTGKIDRARMAIERAKEAQDLPVYIHLLTALAEVKSGNADLARAELDKAQASWPPDLKEPNSIQRSRHLGMIWFESENELSALRNEIESLVVALTP